MITDFHALNGFYGLYKQSLEAALRKQFSAMFSGEGVNGVTVTQMTDAAVTAFQTAWFQEFMNTLNTGYDQFKLKLTEKCLTFLAQANPYVTFVGEQITIFPENTRFWYRGTNCCICVVEEKPQVRTLRFNPANWEREAFRLALPYVIFIFVFQWQEPTQSWRIYKLHLAFRNAPITNSQDMLYEGIFSDLQRMEVCMGKNWKWPQGSIAQQIQEAIHYYWHAEFQTEWLDNYVRICDTYPVFKQLSEWERLSAENPLWILDVKFVESKSLFNYIALLSTKIDGLMDTRFANKQIEDAIASSWEDIKEKLLPTAIDLKKLYAGHLSIGINTITESVVQQEIGSLDTAFQQVVGGIKG